MKLKGHLLSILCVIAWGTSFLVSKGLMEKITPVQLMMLRFVIAWLAIWAIYPKWYFNWKEEGQFIVLSLVGNTFYYLAENTALRLTLASNVSILVSAAPIASALMLRVFERDESLTRHQIAGIGIAFFGVLFVVFNGVFVLKLNPLGDLLSLAAADAAASHRRMPPPLTSAHLPDAASLLDRRSDRPSRSALRRCLPR